MVKFKDSNYFEKLSVQSTTFDSTAKWNFISVGFSIIVESSDATDIIEYSFSGEEDEVHGDLTPGLYSEAMVWDNRRQCQIWFRRKTAGDPVTVRIEAWKSDF